MTPTYDDYAALYTKTIDNFFMCLDRETKQDLHRRILRIADDLTANVQWYMSSVNVQSSEIYSSIREDTQVFTALVKLERLFIMNLTLADWTDGYVKSLEECHIRIQPNKRIVDHDFAESIWTEPASQLGSILAIPGFSALFTIMMFRHCWITNNSGPGSNNK